MSPGVQKRSDEDGTRTRSLCQAISAPESNALPLGHPTAFDAAVLCSRLSLEDRETSRQDQTDKIYNLNLHDECRTRFLPIISRIPKYNSNKGL